MEGLCEEISMMKNLILLAALAWVSFSYASPVVEKEKMEDVESFKVEKPVEEAKRDIAGGKFKKKEAEKTLETSDEDSDSEVRYWQYSE